MTPKDSMIVEASNELVSAYKNAMRRLAASVTIVTAMKEGERYGITATAVTSVTAQPPALLVCVNRSTSVHSILKQGAHFCVNILHHRHVAISNAFGGFIKCEDKFSFGSWLDNNDRIPYLVDAQANLFCQVDGEMDYGSHTIVIGKINGILTNGEVQPLIYQNGAYLGHS